MCDSRHALFPRDASLFLLRPYRPPAGNLSRRVPGAQIAASVHRGADFARSKPASRPSMRAMQTNYQQPHREPRRHGSIPRTFAPPPPSKTLPAAFSAAQTRHNFLIKPLERRGWMKPRPYLYFCVRCRNAWRVNDPRGAIIPLDRNLEPIDGPLRCERIATFAAGPCPAFSITAVRRVHRPHCARCGGWWSRVLQLIAGRA